MMQINSKLNLNSEFQLVDFYQRLVELVQSASKQNVQAHMKSVYSVHAIHIDIMYGSYLAQSYLTCAVFQCAIALALATATV